MNENLLEQPQVRLPRRSRLAGALILVRGVGGGIVGGVIGYFVFRWLAGQGMYGMMIPGALIGLCAGFAARGKSTVLGVICAVAALIAAIVIEWTVFPFAKDDSFAFFLAHLHHLRPMTLLMIGLGGVFAFWLGQGR